MFFVRKSTPGQIRMVIDAREKNRCHRAPPHVSLGSVAALSEQLWSAEALRFADKASVGDGIVWGATIDLSDSFYQFCDDELAGDFGIDFPEPAGYYGVTEIRRR